MRNTLLCSFIFCAAAGFGPSATARTLCVDSSNRWIPERYRCSTDDAKPGKGRDHAGPKTSAAPYEVTLTWLIPSTRENGEALRISDIAGYELYYVSEDESRSGIVEIERADQADYTMELTQPGTYYFAIAAIDQNGVKSQLSDMVRADIGG